MSNLQGKTALVTGASRSIGAGIAKRLAQDGARVAITYAASGDRAAELVRTIESEGGTAIAIRADSADPDAVKRSVSEAAGHFGRIDILVNNAGIVHLAPIGEFSDDEFERLIAINVRAVFIATREALRHMPDGGRIIMIGSVNGDTVPFAGASVYAMTKAAVSGFTHGLARDLGPRNITVNNIQPGPVDTDMNPASGAFAANLKALTALNRYGRVEEIAGLVSYLAGADGAYVTGADWKIDGGFGA